MIPPPQRLRLLQDQLARYWARLELCQETHDRPGAKVNEAKIKELEAYETELLEIVRRNSRRS